MEYYNQPWLDIVTYLTKTLGMTLLSKNKSYETYRMQIKGDIVSVIIKVDECVDGPELRTMLTRDGHFAENIWWHEPSHSGYTLETLDDFNEVEFVRVIIRNSIEFYDAWRDYADL